MAGKACQPPAGFRGDVQSTEYSLLTVLRTYGVHTPPARRSLLTELLACSELPRA